MAAKKTASAATKAPAKKTAVKKAAAAAKIPAKKATARGRQSAAASLGFDPARLQRINDHFAKYVDTGLLPGWQLRVARHGEVAHFANYGMRDMEAGLPVEDDTVFRIYSMTKAITSVGIMALYEEGLFELTDPISKFIPSFAEMTVYEGGPAVKPKVRPATTQITFQHLLNHTSGLTYGFHHIHVQDEIYRLNGFEWSTPPGADLEQCVDLWASMPLRFDPGKQWNYGVSTDVLGRLIEVISGQTLDAFLQERIFDPLGMKDTTFHWRDELEDRLAALYIPSPENGKALRFDDFGNFAKMPQTALQGGGGLLSTTTDYAQFVEMLRRGGELGGAQILGSRTIDYMATNSLPGGADLEQVGIPLFAETRFDGVGFGLGFSVIENPVKYGVLSSKGEYGWGGAASTAFWIDPVEDITVLFMTQLLPSSTYPIRTQLKQLVNQALVD